MQISASAACGLMLLASNVFMTFAWYAHLKNSLCIMGAAYFVFRG